MTVIDLYRAVSAAELADIIAIRQFPVPAGAVEGKYFCLSLADARYFKDQVILDATGIVHSMVSDRTFALLEQTILDQKLAAFANLDTLPMVNLDALQHGGIRRVE